MVLRSLAVNLGFEGLLAANRNLDLLGFGFCLLGEFDLQHTFIIVGAQLCTLRFVWLSPTTTRRVLMNLFNW